MLVGGVLVQRGAVHSQIVLQALLVARVCCVERFVFLRTCVSKGCFRVLLPRIGVY